MDTKRFNDEHAAKSRAVCERIEREDAERRGKLADLVDAQLKSELERAKAKADGWRRFAERRLGYIGECEEALAKRNERISKLEKQVSDLRAELANAKVLSERERAILDMWPKFEDGEYVLPGDRVGLVDDDETLYQVHIRETGYSLYTETHEILDMWPKFEDGEYVLPGDRVGLVDDDETLYQVHIRETGYSLYTETHDEWHDSGDAVKRPAPKDSWERLEEDASKEPCFYFGFEDKPCDDGAGCPANKLGNCSKLKASDIIRRAKALAGVEVE